MVAVLAATLVVGAAVQGLVGLGLGLVAAPVTMLLEPALHRVRTGVLLVCGASAVVLLVRSIF